MSHRIGVSGGGSSILAFAEDHHDDESSTTCMLSFVSPKQITSNSSFDSSQSQNALWLLGRKSRRGHYRGCRLCRFGWSHGLDQSQRSLLARAYHRLGSGLELLDSTDT